MKYFIQRLALLLAVSIVTLSSYGQSPFTGISVETIDNSSGVFTDGEVTYRIYAELSSGLLTQVFADETRPLSVSTTTEFFNLGVFGSIVNFQNQANTGAFGFIAQHEYDSWITFGDSYTDGPGVIGDVGLSDNLVGDTWSFGATLNSDAALFRTPDDLLAAPQDGLILLAQFTTTGDLSGVLNLSGLDADGNPWEAVQVEFTTAAAPVLGCTDASACNFNELANQDDQSCLYPTSSSTDVTVSENFEWNGETYTSGGVYTFETIGSNGCDSIATLNLIFLGQSPFTGISVETIDNSSGAFTDGEVTYRIYAELSSGLLTQVFADETRPLSVSTTTEFFNLGVFGSIVNFQNQANTGAFGFIAQHEYDSWITFGDSYTDGPGVIGDVGLSDNLVGDTWSFGATLNSDAALFRTPDDLLAAPQDGLILLAQFTTTGDLSGVLNLSGLDADGNPWEAVQVEFNTGGTTAVLGCTDPSACNFNELANEDDQSCLYSTSSLDVVSSCESFVWNGETYSTTGVYTYETIGSNSCDSVATLNLTINNSTFSSTDITTCESFDWNGETYSSTGIYTYETIGSNSCDSVATLNLTINNSTSSSTDITSCESFVWNGETYSTTGVYTYETIGSNSCDSVATLNLTINNSTSSSTDITSCESFVWNGETYSSTGVYTYETIGSNSCDSVATLNLTINNSTFSSTDITTCESFDWNGETYSSTGIYTYETIGSNSCDSVATLNLTINNSTSSSTDITSCESFVWNGETYSTTGVYTYETIGSNSCDSVATLNLTINNSTSSSTDITSCESFVWNGETYSSTGVYTYETIGSNSCDSVATLNLTINNSTFSSTDITTCESFVWNGETYSSTGIYTYETIGSNSCDSIATLNLTINNSTSSSTDITTCESFDWNGETYSSSGVYTYETIGSNSCDSIATLNLTINNSTSSSTDITTCESFVWNGETYSTTGVYTYETIGSNSCDSVATLNLTINNSTSSSTDITSCESFVWNGETYSSTGVYTYETIGSNSCDSVATLNLTINNSTFSSTDITTCESFVWNGETYSSTGIYTYETIGSNSCDSIATLNLTINNSTSSSTDITTCESFVWNGETYSTTGVYTYETIGSNSCDSVATLNLTINNSTFSSTDITSCESFVWNGETYSSSGVYTYETIGSNSCDSVATLNLTINNSTFSSTDITTCESFVWNGETYSTTGVYTYETIGSNSCDSVATLNLTINNSTFSSTDITSCESFVWNGETYSSSGVYTYETIGSNSCDSVATLVLTISDIASSSTDITSCENFVWNGEIYSSTGVYTYETFGVSGCDSVATLNLIINNSTSSSTDITSCESFVWNGVTYSSTGIYTFETLDSNGCDSVATLNLTINNSTSSSTDITSCESFVWNGETYSSTGVYTYETIGSNSCDSVATLNLTINNSTFSSTDITSCESFVWNGETYSSTGIYTFETFGVSGCDSVATLNLTINNSTSSSTDITSCESFVWNGETYSSTGVYTYETFGVSGCDSVATLNLIINNSTSSSTDITSCESFVWNGETYSSTGIYTFETLDSNGCDSVATLNLTINNSTSSSTDITSCESFVWNGETYSSTGVYTYETIGSNSCDSVATLNLTINNSTFSSTDISTCESFVWNGETYSSTGVYTYETIGSNSCDSVATLNLTINNSTSSSIDITTCESFVWNGETYSTTGVYTYETIGSNSCDSVATLNLTINNSTFSSTDITSCESFVWNGETYSSSGVYTYETIGSNSCDSVATLNLTIYIIDDCGNCIDGVNFTTSCVEFAPVLDLSLSSFECYNTSDLSLVVTQGPNQPDMSTSLLASDAGYFDFTNILVGQSVGTASLDASAGDLTFDAVLVVTSLPSSSQLILSAINTEDASVMGSFTISNIENGVSVYANPSYNDGNNVTSGNVSSLSINGLFVVPETSFNFYTTINSELGDTDSQSIPVEIDCQCSAENLDAPSQFILEASTPYTGTISWDEVNGADTYSIVYNVPGFNWQTITATTNSFDFEFTAGQDPTISFFVLSVCDNGEESDWSSSQTLQLPSCELDLDLSSTDASCVDGDGVITAVVSGAYGDYTLDFGDIDPLAVSAGTYVVTVTDAGGCSVSQNITIDQEDVAEVSVSAASTTFCSSSSVLLTATSGFSSYQWYDSNGLIIDATSSTYSAIVGGDYYVVVANSDGCSNTSDSENIFEISLDAPTGLTALSIGTNSVSLDWDVTSPEDIYNVRYSSNGGSTWTNILASVGSAITINDLLESVDYTFEISSSSYGCVSAPSTINVITIQSCLFPENIVVSVTPSTFTVDWDAISNADSYELAYNYSGSAWLSETLTENTFTSSHNGNGTISIYVRTSCGEDYTSAWSEIQIVTIPSCELDLDLSSTDASCVDGDGVITAVVSGAYGDYTLDFGDIDPLAVSAGTYTVTVTDAGGCSVSHDITVDQEDVAEVSVSAASATFCSGSSVLLTATSGFSSYQWYDSNGLIADATSSTYSAIVGGDYYVVVANAEGCSNTSDSENVYQYSLEAPTDLILEDVSAFTAYLDWGATSPSGVYNVQYSSDGGSTWTVLSNHNVSGINLSGLESGVTYLLEVTSVSYGCESEASSISFTTLEDCVVPSNILISTTPQNVIFSWDVLSSAESYKIVYLVSGGSWMSEIVTENTLNVPFNLNGGYAYFYVRSICGDGYSSAWSDLYYEDIPSCELDLDLSSTDASCVDGDGVITAVVSGAYGDYTLDFGDIDPLAVSAGTYTVTVTDAGGCSVSHDITVDQEDVAEVSVSAASATFCSGSSVLLTATSGFSSYQWYDSNGLIADATSSTYSAIVGGDYYVVVANAEGCSNTSDSENVYQYSLEAPTDLILEDVGAFTAYLDWGATSPSGVYNVQYSSDGGSTWTVLSNHNVSGINLSGLESGVTYLLEVTSVSYGCESEASSISFTTLEDCVVPSNILISTTPQNATFTWDALSSAESYDIVYGVSGGYWISENVSENSLTISHNQFGYVYLYVRSVCGDGYSSSYSELAFEEIPSCELDLDLSSTDASCVDGDGVITAVVSGAYGDYTLDFGDIDPLAVSAGTYTVTVTDAGGCSVSHDITVDQEDVAEVSVSAASATFCSGSSVLLTATSGFSSYQWYDSNGLIADATSSTYFAIVGGDYYVVVANAEGCSNTSDSENVYQYSLEAPTDLILEDVGVSTAYLDWGATSPSGVYNVQYSSDGGSTWTVLSNHNVSGINLSGLESGVTYLLEVTSVSYGCESEASSISFTTLEDCVVPSNILISTTPQNATFTWDALSSAESYDIVYGVSGGYWISENVSENSLTISHNQFGYVYLYVRSVCGDGYSSSYSELAFEEIPSCELDLDLSSTDASCVDGDGVITAVVSGAYGDYTLDFGDIDPLAVSAGTYTVTVTDAGGCSVSHDITVDQEDVAEVSVSAASATFCSGSSVLLTATSGFSSYQWYDSNGLIADATSSTYSAIVGGDYYVVVANAEGCSNTSDSENVYQYSLEAPTDLILEDVGAFTAYLDWGATSPSGVYNVQYSSDGGSTWTVLSNHNVSGINLSGLESGVTYLLEVTSVSYGCESEASSISFTTLEDCVVPSNILISTTPQNATFTWDALSSAESYDIVYGVSGGYWISENVSENSLTISHNQFGYVYLYVRSVCGDGYSSSYSELAFEEIPSCELDLDLSSTDASCVDGDGVITAVVSGAYGDYTLDFGDIDPLAVSAGTYTVTVTDAGGCSVSHDITVDQEDVAEVSVSAASATFCSGSSVLLTATSGFSSYQWYDSNGLIADATSSTYFAIVGGDYYVVVANAEGCSNTSDSENVYQYSLEAPTDLILEDVGVSTAYLDWGATSPSGVYNVQYSSDGGSTWTVLSNYNVSGINLNGLESGTTYLLEVTSVSYGCESDVSSISFTTLEGCNTPENLLLSATPSEVTFTWDAISNADSYTIAYAYSGGGWSTQSITENTLTISHNGFGSAYFYILTDCGDGYASSWSSLQSISIPSCELDLDLSSTDASCVDGDGVITAVVSGAYGDYTLDFGDIDPLAVSAGTYTVTVTDAVGCSVSHDITVDQEDVADINVSAASATFCSGSSVLLTATSGFSSYQWYDSNGLIADATSSTYSAIVGGDYYVVVANAEGCSNTSDSENVYQYSLEAPTDLVLEDVGVSTAYLDWGATSPSGVYNVQYSSDGGSTWTVLSNYNVSGINLNGLESGTTYLLEVTSVSYGCESDVSSISFTTIEGCDTPINISQEVQDSEVVLSWDAIGNADSYEITYNIGGQGWQSATVSTNSLTVPFNYGYSNSYYIRTVCSNDLYSDWSALQSFTFTCDAPTNFTINEDGGVVTFSWDDNGSEQYNIIYYAGSGWVNQYVSGTSLQISGVPAFFTIYSYLRSVCNSSSSFISPWIFETITTSSGGRFAQVNDFSINVFPNPTNGLVNININVEEKDSYSIRLVDSFGKKVFEENENLSRGEVSYQIDLTNYANGVYHLQIVNGENVRNERIIVQ